MQLTFRLHREQDLILEGIEPEKVKEVEALFDKFGVNPYSPHSLLNRAVTCVALQPVSRPLLSPKELGKISLTALLP